MGALLIAAGIVVRPLIAGEIPASDRRSGYSFMAAETKAMQDDDTINPGMLGVLDGEALWKKKAGAAGKACADCHHDATTSMKGVAVRYPAFDKALGHPVNLEQRINLCRARHQDASPFAYENRDLLALTAFVAEQSRGMAIAPDTAVELEPFIAKGHDFFFRRQGQLNLACANCHNDNWDRHLAGSAVTQAIPNGYPIYRLEWQSLGSLQRRLRNCITGMRAENFSFGAPELVELELYLMTRARGMPVETPAVRP
ncbi:MAG TPA: sulfur oxidation c-type cytochrome SoxA [Bradyrhizobium sp.]|nr:sulfur oxidation c-type cytochrome SoxA [Bradyrhizobium sp.]